MPKYQYDPNAKQSFTSSDYDLYGVNPGDIVEVDAVLPYYFPFTLIDGTVGDTDQPFSEEFDLAPDTPVEVDIPKGYNNMEVINGNGRLYISFQFEGNKRVILDPDEIYNLYELEYDYKAYNKIVLRADAGNSGNIKVKIHWK